MDINGFDAAVAAAVLPPIIAVLNQRRWTAQVKGFVALLVCALYSTGVLLLRGDLHTFANWRDTMLTVAGFAFALYKVWWQPSQIAPAIEAGTSVDDAGQP